MAKRPGVTSDAFQVWKELTPSQNKKNFWNRTSRFWDNPIYSLLSTWITTFPYTLVTILKALIVGLSQQDIDNLRGKSQYIY